MGAGKSAVGRAVARLTSRVFLDLDEAIEQRTGMSIPEIFSTRGEAGFRRVEHAELKAATERANLVVATGGGAFSSAVNRRLIEDSGGISVYLDPPWSVIERRLEGRVANAVRQLDLSVGSLLAGEFQRIAVSATVRPLSAVADFVGSTAQMKNLGNLPISEVFERDGGDHGKAFGAGDTRH